jgi:alpha-glucosidase
VTSPTGAPWWRDAVFYEIYIRSFADADGDGVGDLAGIRSRLPYLRDLGVDALWLTPFYRSPQADHGYDVADPRAVDPLFGTLDDFDALVADAHAAGLRVTVDVVPNHSSTAHPWFQAALRDGPSGADRARYLFRDGRGPDGSEPPNNWRSMFGGPAWTRLPDGQWYLHLFAPEQPDLDWRHPDVPADYERTLRFWLDRGVDGFRIDVAHMLFKAAGLPDDPTGTPNLMADRLDPTPICNQPEVHDVYRAWRRVLDSYAGDRMAVGEVWLGDAHEVARYVRPDELQLAFNFRLLFAPWSAGRLRTAIDRSLAELGTVGAPTTWVLANHDVPRAVSRYGAGETDGALGLRRARAAALLLLALPGPAYLFAGEELGLPDADLPDEVLQDPVWERSGHTIRGRDGCRVPMPWSGDAPPYGFSPGPVGTWLPQPANWSQRTAAAQDGDAGSTLTLYRTALGLRRSEPALGDGALRWLDAPPDVLVFARPAPAGGRAIVCAVNLGAEPVDVPAGDVLISSGDLLDGRLPTDTAVWVAG